LFNEKIRFGHCFDFDIDRVFDTDLAEDLKDPVDLLFGVQLGGETDINKALGYCQEIIGKPDDTIMLLITDLYEGGNQWQMRKRMEEIVSSGVQLICLLALDDSGAPYYDHANAQFFLNWVFLYLLVPLIYFLK
jgi:hypothetical protein